MSITLDDIKGTTPAAEKAEETTTSPKKVSIEDMGIPKAEEAPAEPSFLEEAFSALDTHIDELGEKAEVIAKEKEAEAVDKAIEEFDPEKDDEDFLTTVPTKKIEVMAASAEINTTSEIQKEMSDNDTELSEDAKKVSETSEKNKEFNSLFAADDDDEDEFLAKFEEKDIDDDDSTTDDLTEEESAEILRDYQKQFKSKVKSTSRDLNGFTISKKPINMSTLLNVKEPTKSMADWAATKSCKSFSMVEFEGMDIQKLNPTRNDRNAVNTIKEVYKTLFKHIVGANEIGFEAWLKTTPYKDVAHYFFGAYAATFGDANILTYECPEKSCANMWVEEKPISEMYKFEKPEDEVKFKSMLNKDTTIGAESSIKITPISSKFAMGLCEPSIYSFELEGLLIDDDVKKKFSRIISFLPYIDGIYFINEETNELNLINEKAIPTDLAKTVRNKLSIYFKILSTLNNDELSSLQAEIANKANEEDIIKYQTPEAICPKCGKKIEAVETSPRTMLFNRAQAALVANLSVK